MTSVTKLIGMEMMPGLSSEIRASAGASPYFSYMLGESRMIPSATDMPTKMEATMPLAVVFFQNSSMTMAGKLAEAATAKAQPTRNDTFIPLKMIPRIMAITPTTTAVALPAKTL